MTTPEALPEEVLCLSLDQPYADLVVGGAKTLETRRWPWPYPPSWLVVYATKTPDLAAFRRLELPMASDRKVHEFVVLGALVGLVWIAGCRPMRPKDAEAARYPYEPGRYAWTVEHPCRFAVPDRATLSRGPQKFQRIPRRVVLAAGRPRGARRLGSRRLRARRLRRPVGVQRLPRRGVDDDR